MKLKAVAYVLIVVVVLGYVLMDIAGIRLRC
jgi:hypothetical protein